LTKLEKKYFIYGRDGGLVLRENIPNSKIFLSKYRIFLIFFVVCLLLFKSGFPQDLSIRSVRVKIVVDEEFRKKDSWRQEVKRLIYETSRIFEDNFGIEFKLHSIKSWYSPNSLFSMHALLKDLRQKFSREDTDIILGLTSQYHLKNDLLGVASYLNGFVLLRRIDSSFVMRQTLVHEFSHLFGAIDLNEKKSVMGNGQTVESFDEFSKRIIFANKDRSFQPGSFPLLQQKFDETLFLYRERKNLNLNETDLHVLLALIYLEKGELDAVAEECAQALQVEPDLPEVLNLLGISYRKSGQIDKAIDVYEKVNKIHPYITEVHFNLGIAYMKKGKTTKAELEFKEALKLNPNYAKAYSNLGHLYFTAGKIDEAIKETKKALKIRPNFPEALNNMGSIYMQRKLVDLAAIEYRKAVEANPKFPEAHYNLGRVYLFKGNLDMAVLEFKRAIQLNPGYYKAYSNLASALLKKGQHEEALKASQKSIAIKPDYAHAYFNQGSAYLQLGEIKLAKKSCLLSISFDPLLPESFNLLGVVQMKEGDNQAGIQAFLRALELDPDYLEAHLNLGHYYFSRDLFNEAAASYENVVRIDPQYSLAYNNLAVIFYFRENFILSSQYMRKAEGLGLPVHPDFKKQLSTKLKR